jgi:hypothetical protein
VAHYFVSGMATMDDEHESEWTKGLPSKEELTPLSHSLISQMLANSFRIKHDDPMTEEDVRRESMSTVHDIFKQKPTPSFDPFPAFQERENAGKINYVAVFYYMSKKVFFTFQPLFGRNILSLKMSGTS